ncbi:MAG TPA: NADP-dependent phosphogluconate dehydrogenase [Gammaproteobacteria bacterium]|nr:NADP-dependent phosphogluconate dehydrogenase [Gammaproteobacteria bacterium]
MVDQSQAEIGMVGLGVMGRNLLLNMADHNFFVAGYDIDAEKVTSLVKESQEHNVHATGDIQAFVNSLRKPRAIILLVPAGAPVDAAIKDFVPLLQPGDLIIDAGNSYFKDTDRRAQDLKAKGIHFMGMGVSGGEAGARHGPSMMPGGPKEAYERLRPLLEAVAAKVKGEPCVTYIGLGSAGHFVKMVHNGIEYGIMQLISETYALMKLGLRLTNQQLHEVYSLWNQGELSSYLLEITSHIFSKLDDKTGKSLIDMITPVAAQKGTGMWTSQIAMELQVPVPTIDIAVAMRDLSGFVSERQQASVLYPSPTFQLTSDATLLIQQLQQALFASLLIVYAQGMALLKVASDKYQYQLHLEDIARIWRGGCIIRAALLEDIRSAFQAHADLPNLLLDANLAEQLKSHENGLRQVVGLATKAGIAIPGLTQSLSYLDSYRSAWLPANLIQAQRDYFGSHTYRRLDRDGIFHTEWDS